MTNAQSTLHAHARLPAEVTAKVRTWAAAGKLRDSSNTTVTAASTDAPIADHGDNAPADLGDNAPAPPTQWPTEPDATTAWSPLGLFMAILPGPAVITPILALGQNHTHFIALALEPTTPFVLTIARDEAFAIKQHVLPGITGYNSIQQLLTEDEPLPLIKPSRRLRGPVTALFPINQPTLAFLLANDTLHHPATLHATLTAPDANVADIASATAIWLRCACNHQSTKDPLTSKLTLPIEPAPLAFPLEFAATIIADLREGLDAEAEPLITAMSTAGLFPNRHTPAATNAPAVQPPAAAPTRTPTAVVAQATPTPPTRGYQPAQGPAAHVGPTTAAFTPRTINYNPQPPTNAWQRPGAPGQQSVTPDPYRNQYATHTFPGHHAYTANTAQPAWRDNQHHLGHPAAPPHHVDLTGSDTTAREMAQAKLATLLSLPREFTPDEITLIGHLTTVTTTSMPATVAAPLSRVNQNRLYNLLGFAGLTPADIPRFHHQTNHAWESILQEATKAGREAQVKQHIIHPLRAHSVRLTHRLNDDIITTIAQLAFSPEPYSTSGSKCGLGPLAFVTRTFLEVTAATAQRDINTEATSVTTADVIKAKLGSPIMPRSVHEVTEVLKSMHAVLKCLFTETCPFVKPLDDIIKALGRTSPLFEQIQDYQNTVAAEILWQITLATKTFFDDTKSYADLAAGRCVTTNIKWMADAIDRGHIAQSVNRAPAFHQARDHNTKRNRNRGNNRQHPTPTATATTPNGSTTATKKTRRDQPDAWANRYANNPEFQPHKRTLSPACAAIMAKNPRRRYPKVADIRRLLNLDTDAALARHIGAVETDCLHYVVYGKCHNPLCHRKHTGTSTSAVHAALLTKTFNAIAEST